MLSAAGETASNAVPPIRCLIDHTAFPGIVDLIFGYATYDNSLVIRQTSRAFLARMEAKLCHHVYYDGEYLYPPRRYRCEADIKPIPFLRLDRPFLERTIQLLTKHTRILDDGDCGSGEPPFKYADVFRNLRCVRRDRQSYQAVAGAKAVLWQEIPTFAHHQMEWDSMICCTTDNIDGFGTLVFHCSYDKRSVVPCPFPPTEQFKLPLAKMVYIFTYDPSICDGLGHLGCDYSNIEEWRRKAQVYDHRCGRGVALYDVGAVIQTIGLAEAKDAPNLASLKIVLVGMEDVVDTPSLPGEDDDSAFDRLRSSIMELFKSKHGMSAAMADLLVGRITFMTHEDYKTDIGPVEYQLETSQASWVHP